RIPEVREVAFGYLSQDTTHDLTRTGFRKCRHKLNFIEFGNRPDMGRNMVINLVSQIVLVAIKTGFFQRNKSVKRIAFDVVRKTYNCRLGYSRVLVDGIFDRSRSKVVPRNDDYIIYTSCNSVITNFVSQGPIPRKVFSRKGRKVRVNIALVVSPNGSGNSRPRKFNTQASHDLIVFDFVSLFVHQYRLHSRKWQRSIRRLRGRHKRNRSNHDAAGFGLPPRVSYRATLITYVVVVPVPSLLVDRFSNRTNHFQRR